MKNFSALFLMLMVTLSTLAAATPAQAHDHRFERRGGVYCPVGGPGHHHWPRWFRYCPGPGWVQVYDPILGYIWVPRNEVY